MKAARKKIPVQVVVTKEQNKKYQKMTGLLCLSLLFALGSILAMYRTMGSLKTGIVGIVAAVVVGVATAAVAYAKKKEKYAAMVLHGVPWIVFLIVTGFHGYWSGAKAWLNEMISMWNQIHEGGIATFSGESTQHDMWAFAVMMALLIGQVSWRIVAEGHMVLGEGWSIMWGVLMLLTGTFSAMTGSFLLAGILGLGITGRNVQITRTSMIWIIGFAAGLCICAGLTGDSKMMSVEEARADAMEKIHELRYGKSCFPEGNLYQSDELKKDNGTEFLNVTSEQKKTLYLKAFVGGVYLDGKWEKMPDSEYGAKNAGMFPWLEEKGFSPLEQSAQYYKAGKEKNIKSNRVKIEVNSGSRDYFYAPASLQSVTSGKVKPKQDQILGTTGLTGERNYTYKEMSGVRPSELMVAADWVEKPKTKTQKAYSEAEAVYRQFVYDHYTAVDKKMYALVDEIFWNDYSSESDGIYSALTQIRTVLKEQYQYTETTDMNHSVSDPIRYFLETSYQGNDMLYASAAVEAFRVHGIPARYVEGYYVPAKEIAGSKGGKTKVTGKNAHAWVEVYFDGVGWLPVDVTPGYYYDVAALQKMVNTPENVQKNAALNHNSFGGKQSTDLSSAKNKAAKRVKKAAVQIVLILLGIFALGILLLAAVLSVAEILRMIIRWKDTRRYEKASVRKKVDILEKELFCILQCMGIQARLGWNTKMTAQQLRKLVEQVETGEYERVCELFEKVVYGDMELEKYEVRTLESFLKKLLLESKKCSPKIRLKIRYRYIPLQ